VTPPLPPVLLLCAGLGTRLRPLSYVRAKAAIPVAGTPLVARLLSWLATSGAREVVINLHHLPATITRVVGDGAEWGLRVRYSWEAEVLGSGGGPRHALPLLDGDPFLLVNGDTLCPADLGALVRAHEASAALVTMTLVPNLWPERYGGVLVDAGGAITGFTRRGEARPSYHFVGSQCAARSVFAALEDGVAAESVNGVYRELLASRPGSIRAFITDAPFDDIGTPADYVSTSARLAAGLPGGATPVPATARIAPDARLDDVILWDGVTVEAGAVLERVIVTDRVCVQAGTAWRDRILLRSGSAPPTGDSTDDGVVLSFPLVARPDSRRHL
jgi:mannose-1-phosphate guanylyltransferase